ncbi:MAG TPA: hypothetical protein VFQ83_00890 [Candidatus Udaeobacter sp.]|jgi:outer membrane protein assembly factor BamE (lipoprotein component of BamABCDE complex)|nr:hypothetical protein [Candidatus Udaeobacter sp.]
MRRHLLPGASALGIAAGTLLFIGCSTPQTRISDRPDLYQSLSARDQALVSQGQLRSGMSRSAVWLAWGSPDQKVVGNMAGTLTETWIYVYYATYPYYPYYGPGPWGPWGPWGANDSTQNYSLAYTRVGAPGGSAGVAVAGGRTHNHGGRTFVFFGSPFYDPFYWSYIPPSIPYPGKVVTFVNGRVMSFQYLTGY